jgi:hypothetical protein
VTSLANSSGATTQGVVAAGVSTTRWRMRSSLFTQCCFNPSALIQFNWCSSYLGTLADAGTNESYLSRLLGRKWDSLGR